MTDQNAETGENQNPSLREAKRRGNLQSVFLIEKADRSYPAYPSVSRRAQVAGTGATLAMT